MPGKHRKQIGCGKYLLIETHGGLGMAALWPLRTSFYVKITICCRYPVRMPATKADRRTRRIKRKVYQQHQRPIALHLLSEICELFFRYLICTSINRQNADAF